MDNRGHQSAVSTTAGRRNAAKICGTHESVPCWCSTTDSTGILFVSVVWVAAIFIIFVLIFITVNGDIDQVHGYICGALLLMSVWSHLKTVFSDPGAVPVDAAPLVSDRSDTISICGRCDSYKPPKSHHGKLSVPGDLLFT